ncbi:MAG TPA: adenylate/guanylate cyclase domain-containing protein [Alphaproteobacteria bacterium]|jgi:adenylate cyclase|nr:adenylate/guanylate cyclase domain-containing protein [Alphaproteobacteria bacterium]
MSAPDVQRKLAAVLAADMVGYSRLMEANEAGTLARLKAHRIEMIEPAIAKCKGRLIKTTGDGMLVEFPSVVEAVRCAVDFQGRMARRNADLPADQRIEYRIGINLGDIIVEEDDIFGDGVNIAARLQEQSAPGGICVSQGVHDQIGDRYGIAFEDLGERSLKNIVRPVRVYRVLIDGAAPAAAAPRAAAAPVSDKPSIAVLPFVNMSGDREQEFFVDGMTEDIITELSRFRDLFVISRNSAFVYKGKAVNIQKVAGELGVQYVVEGSVRKAGNRVRVTVQLIDAETDRHIWAERYDRELEDIFAIQDEVTAAIVATVSGRIAAAAQDRVQRKTTNNMAAYEFVLAGKVLHHRSTREDNAEALQMLDRAIALDPKFAHAHAWKACTLGQGFVYGWSDDPNTTFKQIGDELQTALGLDDNDSDVHRIQAAVCLLRHDYDKAMYHQERALNLNPNNDLIVVQQGEMLTWLGRPDEGIDWILKAMRLNPYHPERFWNHLGRAYYVARRYPEAIEAFRRIGKPDHTHFAFMAAAAAQMGDAATAAGYAREVLARQPAFSIGTYVKTLHYKNEADLAHHREGLSKAGFPD